MFKSVLKRSFDVMAKNLKPILLKLTCREAHELKYHMENLSDIEVMRLHNHLWEVFEQLHEIESQSTRFISWHKANGNECFQAGLMHFKRPWAAQTPFGLVVEKGDHGRPNHGSMYQARLLIAGDIEEEKAGWLLKHCAKVPRRISIVKDEESDPYNGWHMVVENEGLSKRHFMGFVRSYAQALGVPVYVEWMENNTPFSSETIIGEKEDVPLHGNQDAVQ